MTPQRCELCDFEAKTHKKISNYWICTSCLDCIVINAVREREADNDL